MPLGMVKVMRIANAPSNIKYQGPRSAKNPRNKKKTIVPINGPSIRPMPPITTMKMTNAVQSVRLKAEVVSADVRVAHDAINFQYANKSGFVTEVHYQN